MNARELRIGSLVHLDGDVIRVCLIGDEIVDTSMYEPIPLTEEWLLKFGFESRSVGLAIKQYLLNDLWEITINEDGIIKVWIFDEYGSSIDIKIKHVHQLQNLYFALTGEELTIQE